MKKWACEEVEEEITYIFEIIETIYKPNSDHNFKDIIDQLSLGYYDTEEEAISKLTEFKNQNKNKDITFTIIEDIA